MGVSDKEEVMTQERFFAWAIDTGDRSTPGFIGRYWWFRGTVPEIPRQLEGSRHVLFTTRRIARSHLSDVRGAFPKARVVRVCVRIEEV